MITKINIYLNRNEWCYSAWTSEGYDHSDPISDATSEDDARAEMREQFPDAEIVRVADTNE